MNKSRSKDAESLRALEECYSKIQKSLKAGGEPDLTEVMSAVQKVSPILKELKSETLATDLEKVIYSEVIEITTSDRPTFHLLERMYKLTPYTEGKFRLDSAYRGNEKLKSMIQRLVETGRVTVSTVK